MSLSGKPRRALQIPPSRHFGSRHDGLLKSGWALGKKQALSHNKPNGGRSATYRNLRSTWILYDMRNFSRCSTPTIISQPCSFANVAWTSIELSSIRTLLRNFLKTNWQSDYEQSSWWESYIKKTQLNKNGPSCMIASCSWWTKQKNQTAFIIRCKTSS